ncbi:sigma-54 interaction domain-containing protein [Pseudomonas sp. NPDC089743]|uniref:sigma-54 interaction domain-containing protein n=1 Tax=Pseudomonas sp. NPDC089743 TaxID=3364471 RepID=UPI0038237066
MPRDSRTYGLLVLDEAGRPQLRCGVALDDALLAQILPQVRDGKRQLTGISQGGSDYVVAALPLAGQGSAVLIQVCDGADELVDFLGTVDFAPDILNQLLTSPFDGMTVVDRDGCIVYISPVHEKYFGLDRGAATGRHVTEIIKNSRLHVVARSGQPEIGQMHKMHGQNQNVSDRIVSRLPVQRNGEVVGAIGRIMFKGPDQLLAMSREISALKSEVEYYKREAKLLRKPSYEIDDIIGDSKALKQLKADMRRVARLDVPVLILGESGTGKELVAQALHQLSQRREKPMVMVNAGALPENLVESELFGHEAGAFTGAKKNGRQGKFEAAHNGSLFLDEIGEMPLEMQVKLLRVLQDGSFERVGGDERKFSNFRLIAATNRELGRMIEEETFRLDLYYRISGVTLHVPPLRERLEDIPALVDHFIRSFATRQNLSRVKVHPEVYDYLQRQQWPGNIRQLQHEVEHALIFCDGNELAVDNFPHVDIFAEQKSKPRSQAAVSEAGEELKTTLDRVELLTISEAMTRHRENKKRVAEELGISRSYLYKRLRDLEDS